MEQARSLYSDQEVEWVGDQRALVSDLYGLVPERAHTLSSDPAGVRARLNRYEYTRRHEPQSETLLPYLVGILIRLDRCEDFETLVERVIEVGDIAAPVLAEVIEQIESGEGARHKIRQGAIRALRAVVVPSTQ